MKTSNKKFLTVIAMVLITLLMVSPSLYAKSLNPKSQGNWVTLQVDLTGFSNLDNVSSQDVSLHYNTQNIKADKFKSIGNKHKTNRILVKFGRAELIKMLKGANGNVTLPVKVKGTKVKDFIIKMTPSCHSGKSDPSNPDSITPKIQTATIDKYSITLTYNEALDEESIPDEGDFSVYVSNRIINEPTQVDINDNKVILLLPRSVREGLAVKISYTPGTNPILDLAGNKASAIDLMSVNNNNSETTPPFVFSSIPDDQAFGVGISDNITILFNEDIKAGVNISSISFNDEEGDFSYRIQNNKLILNPDDDFAYYTEYTVMIPSRAVKDLDGNSNTSTWQFSFTTGGPGLNYLSAGGNHSAAREDDGQVLLWGAYDNLHEVSSPAPVTSLQDVIAVSSGTNYTLALKKDGTVWAWGDNYSGQLGNGNSDLAHTTIPAKVVGPEESSYSYLTDIIAIAAGDRHALALKSDGTVWAWGDNSLGQLGNADNDYEESFYPVQVQNKNANGALTNIIDIDCGYEHSLALEKDGTVWAWGSNEYSQLGIDPEIEYNVVPVQVVGTNGIDSLTNVKDIDAGGFYNISLKNDGTVFSWGLNSNGQLGNSLTSEESYTPVKVRFPSSTEITSLSAGGYEGHSLAIDSEGYVWAWGSNDYGQLGINSYQDKDIPFKISTLDDIIEISAGGEDGHSMALDKDGRVWAWGSNQSGQLGLGSAEIDQSNEPVRISDLDLISE